MVSFNCMYLFWHDGSKELLKCQRLNACYDPCVMFRNLHVHTWCMSGLSNLAILEDCTHLMKLSVRNSS